MTTQAELLAFVKAHAEGEVRHETGDAMFWEEFLKWDLEDQLAAIEGASCLDENYTAEANAIDLAYGAARMWLECGE